MKYCQVKGMLKLLHGQKMLLITMDFNNVKTIVHSVIKV